MVVGSTLSIMGVEFDHPSVSSHPMKFRLSRQKVSARKTVTTLWVDSYLPDGYAAHSISVSNTGAVEFDGRRLSDPRDLEAARSAMAAAEDIEKKETAT